MRERNNEEQEEGTLGASAALFDERTQSDERLDRERDLVDTAVGELEHDTRFPRSTRAFVHRLRERVARLREASDVEKNETRHETDRALLDAGTDQVDANQGLWAILTELDAIADAVMTVREAPAGRVGEVDMFNVAGAVEVAANRILEIVENILDPDDDRGLYHETGASG